MSNSRRCKPSFRILKTKSSDIVLSTATTTRLGRPNLLTPWTFLILTRPITSLLSKFVQPPSMRIIGPLSGYYQFPGSFDCCQNETHGGPRRVDEFNHLGSHPAQHQSTFGAVSNHHRWSSSFRRWRSSSLHVSLHNAMDTCGRGRIVDALAVFGF